MKKKILVTEEQLKHIINYISLNEQVGNTLPNWGKKSSGQLSFQPGPFYATFKNNGLFSDLNDNEELAISIESSSLKLVKEEIEKKISCC